MTQARPMRGAGGLAVGWGVVLLGWAAYNCFGQVGFATYLKGIFYYGGTSVDAETGSLNYGLLYLLAGLLLLRGRNWALGVAAGVALVEGYNRVRSLTGALLDKPQREWFTGTTEGWLKLATFALGVVVTATLIALLARSSWRDRPEAAPAGAPWPVGQTAPTAPQPAPYGLPQPGWHQQPPAQPAWHQQPAAPQQPQPQPQPQPAAWPPAQPQQVPPPSGYAQQPQPQPQPQPQAAPAYQPTVVQQQWPAPAPAPGQPATGPVAPGPVVPPPADAPPVNRPPQA